MKKDRRRLNAFSGNDEGAVLLLVLLVLALISVMVLSLGQEWRTELKLAANFQEAHQCRRLAEAGVYFSLGKLAAAKSPKTAIPGEEMAGLPRTPGETWSGDQRPYVLELPEGRIEVRVADEGGKINLNRAPEAVLLNFINGLGVSELQVRIMVDSILDWRSRGYQARPYGAKSDYYLRLDPPYVCKNGKFETVEELAWVRGFDSGPLLPRWGDWLTVLHDSNAINISTAAPEVLRTLGFPPDAVQAIMAARQIAPLFNLEATWLLTSNPLVGQNMQISFISSSFFTIKSTGMVKENGGRHTIKAMVRLRVGGHPPWEILSWVDDFPG